MNSRLYLTIILAAFSGLTHLFAQDYFQPIGGPYGVEIRAMCFDTSSNPVAAVEGKGVFRSFDGGINWEIIEGSAATKNPVYLDISPNNTLFMVGDKRLFSLKDGDQMWILKTLPGLPDVKKVQVSPNGIIYANDTFGRIYFSTNDGVSFTKITNTTADNFWVFGNDLNFFYSKSFPTFKFYKFMDDGSNVQEIPIPSIWNIFDLAFHESYNKFSLATDKGLFVSSDQGNTWVMKIIDPNIQTGFPWNIYVVPTNEIFIFNDFVYSSTDGGETFVRHTGQPFNDKQSVWSRSLIKYSPDGKRWFVNSYCSNTQFAMSDDEGLSWQRLDNHFLFPNTSLIAGDQLGNLFVKTCNIQGFDKSPDNGESWTPVLDNDQKAISSLDINHQNEIFAFNSEGEFLKSTDQGASWTGVVTTFVLSPYKDLSIAPNGDIFLKDNLVNLFYKSEDNGLNWSLIPVNFNFSFDPAYHPDGSIFVKGGNKLWKSTDAGFTWNKIYEWQTELIAKDLEITAKGTILAEIVYNNPVGNPAIVTMRSLDSGATFDFLNTPGPFKLLTSNAAGDLFNAGYQGLFISKDDGSTWSNISAGLKNPASISYVYVHPNQHIYVGMDNDAVYKSILPSNEILTSSKSVFSKTPGITVQPNPLSDKALITINSESNSKLADFRLFNNTGKLVRQENFSSKQFDFHKKDLTSGLYFFQITVDGLPLGAGKLIIN